MTSTSWSEKSIAVSARALRSDRSFLTARIASPRAPRRIAITLSAHARSSRPLRKARRVNSPGAASRAPAFTKAARIISRSGGEPMVCTSTTSSRVYE